MVKTRTATIGILQFDIALGDPEANINKAQDGIARLGDRGAQLVLLPEMWSCGFDRANLARHAARTPDIIGILTGLALKYNLMIAGSLPEAFQGGICNSMHIVAGSGIIGAPYRKIHLFLPTGENRCFSAGSQVMVYPTDMGVLGAMICYDLRFPELCRLLAVRDASIILISAQWPSRRIHHWDALLKARAIENQVFVVASNRWGNENDLSFPGHSQVVSPQGEVMCFLGPGDAQGLVVIDLNEIKRFRDLFDTVRERRLVVEPPGAADAFY